MNLALSKNGTSKINEKFDQQDLPYGYQNWSEEEKKNHIKGEKSLLYVAITRAIQKVVITGTGQKSTVLG